MKLLTPALLLASAGALAWVAVRSPEPSYQPIPEERPAPEHVPKALSGAVPAGYVVRTFEVEGMCCQGCPGKLWNAVTDVPGVVEAAVDFETGSAEAVVPSDLDVACLETAMTFDEYRARARPVPPAE